MQVGVRPMRDSFGRVQGEVFIYDNVPGGAGYARAIQDNLRDITATGVRDGTELPQRQLRWSLLSLSPWIPEPVNPITCWIAISQYRCLSTSWRVIRPSLGRQHAVRLATGVEEYLRSEWAIVDPSICPEQFGAVFGAGKDVHIGIRPIHPLSARPMPAELEKLRDETGIFPRVYTSFDLVRRPFWVANDLLRLLRR